MLSFPAARGKADSPKNARRAKGNCQQTVSSVGREDKFLGLGLGFVVSVKRLFGGRHALIGIDEVLTVEDYASGAGVDKFRNLVFLGSGNDGLGAIYVYLPIEGRILESSGW
jgi:hypothetical protein